MIRQILRTTLSQTPRDARQTLERRKRARHQFAAPLRYRLVGREDASRSGTGLTVNMSAEGMLVDLCRATEPGTRIELSIDWPGLYHGAVRVRLMVTAKVLRTDGHRVGVKVLDAVFRTSGVVEHASTSRRAVT